MNVRTILLITSLLSFPVQVAAADVAGALRELDASIAEAMARSATPGAATLIVQNGKVIHQRTHGIESVETKRPVRPDSLFRIGSTAKMFVALAVLRLEDSGKVELDRPISTWAPDLDPAIGRLTLDQLLRHSAGLSDEAPMHGPLEEKALSDRVEEWSRDRFFTEPGRIFSYSNPGYVLISYVIEKVTGKPFSAAMRELVFDPMGMSASTFLPLEAITHPLAQPHQRGRDGVAVVRPFPENAANYAPGSLFTNLVDLESFFVNVTSPESEARSDVARLAKTRSHVSAMDTEYGYGLEIQTMGGIEMLSHRGARAGYGSFIAIIPARRIAVAVLTNKTGEIFNDEAQATLRDLLTLDDEGPPKPVEYVEGNEESLGRYVGLYVNSDAIRTTIARTDTGLGIVSRKGVIPARQTADGRFHAPGAGPLTWFRIITNDQNETYLVGEMWATRKVSQEGGKE